jgi:hypothetical protein
MTAPAALVTSAFADFSENASPGDPAADVARLYALDEGGTTNLAFRRSDGTRVRFRPAVQSEMEAASEAEVFVPPARQHFHPGHPKAAGRGDSSGGIVGTAYNVASIVRNSIGKYTVTLTTGFSDANYAVLVTANHSVDTRVACAIISSATTFTVETFSPNGSNQDCDFSFAAFGDMS